MTIEIRTVVDKIEILRGGITQVRRVNEFYDPSITPQDAIEEVTEDIVIEPEVSEIVSSGPNAGKKAIISPAVMGVNIITPGQPKITGIETTSPPHRTVYMKNDTLPDDVKAFIAEANNV